MKPTVVILSAFATPFRSGAEACSEEVARVLLDRYDITIVAARMRRDLLRSGTLPGGIPVIRVGLGLPIDRWLYPFLAPFAVRKLQPQIIHAVLESFAGLAMIFCRFTLPKAKRLLTLQSTNTSFLLGPMHHAAHRITAISTTLVERAKRYHREDVVIIPNGIDWRAMEAATKKIPKATPLHVLFVGRLESMKGVDTLLHAFAQLPEHLKDRTQLHVVGDGSQRAMLGVLAGELNISSHVIFKGYLPPPAVYDEYAGAEIFCGLSRSEALGNVFLEAQAAGCAVVAANVGGIPDIVMDGQTGLLVPADDPHAAMLALEKLLSNEDLRRQFQDEAIWHAMHFDWGQIALQYEEIYLLLLGEPKS